MDSCPDKSSVFWFHYKVVEERRPWAFVQGSPKRCIAALEMLGTLVRTAFLIEQKTRTSACPSFPSSRATKETSNVFSVYSLLDSKSRKMPSAGVVMEFMLLLPQKLHLGILSHEAGRQPMG